MTSSSAAAATVIGSAAPGTIVCGTGIDTVQLTSTTPSYAVPAGGGNLTSWSISAGGATGPTALLVWRPTAAADTFTLVGESTLEMLTPNAMNTFTLGTPIAAQAGDLIGLRLEGPVECAQAGLATDSFGYFVGATAAVGGAEAMLPNFGFMLNVSATVGTVTPPPPPPSPVPTDKDQCKNNGWKQLADNNGHPFPNQGQCVSFVTGSQDDSGSSGDQESGANQQSGGDHQSTYRHESGDDNQSRGEGQATYSYERGRDRHNTD